MADAADGPELSKAKSFFARAAQFAERNNYDYAIDMYLDGLKHAPDALEEGHIPLFQIANQRQGKGGKKPSMMDKMKRRGGKTPLERMLNAEYLFSKDPNHLAYAEDMLRGAVDGGFNRTAGWLANLVFQTNNAADRPSAMTYVLLKDSYAKLGQFDKALVACQKAAALRPEDSDLADEFKNLSAELTMARGNYDKEGDFRKSIKNREEQEKLHAQAGVIKTVDYRVKAVEDARKKLAAEPDIPKNVFDLAEALSDMQTNEAENEAIDLLERTSHAKNDFSYKERAGLLRIKQLRRKIRQTRKILDADPDSEKAKTVHGQLTAYLAKIELEHYHLCMKNYPTDLRAKYEYAVRLVQNQKYDEAIPLFQEAQKDPRRKIGSMNQIGCCFFKKGWFADAIDVLDKAIETYKIKDDATGKELRYNLARAHEEKGDTQKALEIYRKIAQTDFSYKDVSARVDRLRGSQNN
ncbi:MAG: tetratricopeptide repeat protein [Sedimentisphaerales bacterium]|nr:tetratricopeptide repeat protein [Sedimentisphaerales bacterium]